MKKQQEAAASLRLADVSFSYNAQEKVLAGLNFELAAGDFVAVLGPSGCGKSTLIRLIAALDAEQAGRVILQPADAHLGVVFQEPRLLPWRSVVENVSLPLELSGVAKAPAQAEAAAAVARIGLEHAMAKYPRELSGGMKMRAAMARALVSHPRLLLLDEPFSALDEQARLALQQDLRQLWEREGMTVILVTHSLPEAAYLANRVLVLAGRPASVAVDATVQLPRQREAGLRRGEAFQLELQRLRSLMSSAENERSFS